MVALPASARADDFETRLAPSPSADGTRVNIAGEGRVKASLDGGTLTVSGNFHGLVSAATAAALYNGAGIAVESGRRPSVHHPGNGNAIFVVALPDN